MDCVVKAFNELVISTFKQFSKKDESIECEQGLEVKWKLLSSVRLFVTPWAMHSMEFSRPEYWRG